MPSCQNDAAATDGLFSTYYVFSKILFDYVKPHLQVLPELEVEQMFPLPILDILSYELAGLNVKMPVKQLSNYILDKDYGPISHGLEKI